MYQISQTTRVKIKINFNPQIITLQKKQIGHATTKRSSRYNEQDGKENTSKTQTTSCNDRNNN